MNQQSKHPVAIEDLLRLKRAERPVAEFWTEFDRELRQKQLAALVAKRPWWRTLPRSLRGLARYHLPLGATAVLAVTLLSIRDYQAISPAANQAASSSYDVTPRETAVPPVATSEVAPATEDERGQAAAPEVTPAAAPVTAMSSEANSPGEFARMIPGLAAQDPTSTAELRPSARSIAENRAVAEAMLGTSGSSFEARALPARITPTEPLAQMSNPAETRRSRFALAFAAASISTSPAPTARVASRLSDEQLYDTIRRFGASGNSVSFRF